MSMSILPQDLLEEILCRVPVSSLKQLRSTCRRWRILFNDHRFIKKHFDKAPKELTVLMRGGVEVYFVTVDFKGVRNNIDPSIEFKDEFGLVLGDRYSSFSNCSGLLLCTKHDTMRDVGRLMLYNPCMGQTRSIELLSCFKTFDIFALGYQNDKSCRANYKILRFGFYIYDFSSNSWRVLRGVTHDWNLGPGCRGVSFKGNTYWIASDRKYIYDTFLLKFDFTEERFQRFRLPFECDCRLDTVVLSTVREEQVAVFLQRYSYSTMEVWLTTKIDDPSHVPWRLLFKVDSGYVKNIFHYPMSFMVDEEEKVAMCCCQRYMGKEDHDNRGMLYIVGEGIKFRHIGSTSQPNFWMMSPFLFGYVPSLVQI